METFEIPGSARDTSLRIWPLGLGKLELSAWSLDRIGLTGGRESVILLPTWLRPLAAWFAGEAEPTDHGDGPDNPYGYQLAVVNDEAAVVWSAHTWALLRCLAPYGHARVTVAIRNRSEGPSVILTPEDRMAVAEYLRRVDAEHWTASAV